MAKPKTKSKLGGDSDVLFQPAEKRPYEVAANAEATAKAAGHFANRAPSPPAELAALAASSIAVPPAAAREAENSSAGVSKDLASAASLLQDTVIPATGEDPVAFPEVMLLPSVQSEPKASEAKVDYRVRGSEEKGRGRRKTKAPTSAEEAQARVEVILRRIRSDLPGSNGPNQRMFFPRELPQKLTAARCLLLDHRHKIPERSIALSGVLNFLEQLEKVHGGPFLSTVNPDPQERAALGDMVGEFKGTPQESFSFGIDDVLQQRLRVVSEYLGVKIRQIVATGTMNFLLELEDIYGCPFEDIGQTAPVLPVVQRG